MTKISAIASEATSAADDDWVEIETAAGTSKKIKKSNLLGGGMVLLEEHVFSSAAANHTFTGFSASFRDLMVVVRGRGDNAALTVTAELVLNGDTGNNYDRQETQITTSVASTINTFGSTAAVIGSIPGDTASAGSAGLVECLIGDYRGTTFHKVMNAKSQIKKDTSAGNYVTFLNSVAWRSTSAITSILARLGSSANFKAGSVVSLYGIP